MKSAHCLPTDLSRVEGTWQCKVGHRPTQHYLTRRRVEQKSDTEIRRCLKRYTAHLFRLMERTATPHPPNRT